MCPTRLISSFYSSCGKRITVFVFRIDNTPTQTTDCKKSCQSRQIKPQSPDGGGIEISMNQSNKDKLNEH